jgi:hypothetical protein
MSGSQNGGAQACQSLYGSTRRVPIRGEIRGRPMQLWVLRQSRFEQGLRFGGAKCISHQQGAIGWPEERDIGPEYARACAAPSIQEAPAGPGALQDRRGQLRLHLPLKGSTGCLRQSAPVDTAERAESSPHHRRPDWALGIVSAPSGRETREGEHRWVCSNPPPGPLRRSHDRNARGSGSAHWEECRIVSQPICEYRRR